MLQSDSSVSGSRLGASGSPLLSHFLRETAEDITHPTDKERNLWDARSDVGVLFGLHENDVAPIKEEVISIHEMQYANADSVGVSPLGSGSDYTVFLQRNGVCDPQLCRYVLWRINYLTDSQYQRRLWRHTS